MNVENVVILRRSKKMKTLTHKDMYDDEGECILPKGELPRKHRNRSKYLPAEEDKKHQKID